MKLLIIVPFLISTYNCYPGSNKKVRWQPRVAATFGVAPTDLVFALLTSEHLWLHAYRMRVNNIEIVTELEPGLQS